MKAKIKVLIGLYFTSLSCNHLLVLEFKQYQYQVSIDTHDIEWY
jgi:hypothetical protein